METAPALDLWWRFAAILALETSVIVLIAFVWQSAIASAAWRRTIWQACALGVLTLLALELSGGSRVLTGWLKLQRSSHQATAPAQRTFSITISETPEPSTPLGSASKVAPGR